MLFWKIIQLHSACVLKFEDEFKGTLMCLVEEVLRQDNVHTVL